MGRVRKRRCPHRDKRYDDIVLGPAREFTADVWAMLHDKFAQQDGTFTLKKALGSEHTCDILTKRVTEEVLRKMMKRFNMDERSGRSAAALAMLGT